MENKTKKLVLRVRILLFILLLVSYCFTSSDDIKVMSNSFIKYAVLFLCVIESGIEYFYKRSDRKGRKEYKGLFITVCIIICYSLIRSLMTVKFTFRTVQELIFLIFPMIYGYFVINTWKYEDVNKALKLGLIISFLFYIISLKMSLSEVWEALLNADFNTSYSKLESFTYCGLALSFCVYFCFFDDKKIYKILSVLFVIMTFKRIFIIMAIILFILSKTRIKNKKVSNNCLYCMTIVLFVFAIFYYIIMQPQNVSKIEQKYNINVRQLTMTRNDRMRWLVNSQYESYGFGSSTEFMYNRFFGALEMDLPKMIIELGYLPVLIFIYNYLKFSRRSYYTFGFMVLMILNLTVSSGLTGTFAWCILFITISIISEVIKDGENSEYGKS